MLRRLLRRLALEEGRAVGLWRRLCRPDGRAWATYLRRHGGLYRLGHGCTILPSTTITDPAYTAIGDRVCLGNCTLICHDGAIEMIEQAHGMKLDRIGPITLEDDVYVGEGAIVIGSDGVTIGRGSIVGAGAVVRQSVPPGSVVVGNPAKVVAKVEDVLRFWEADFHAMAWRPLIEGRRGAYDPAIEPELRRLRQIAFFGKAADGQQPPVEAAR